MAVKILRLNFQIFTCRVLDSQIILEDLWIFAVSKLCGMLTVYAILILLFFEGEGEKTSYQEATQCIYALHERKESRSDQRMHFEGVCSYQSDTWKAGEGDGLVREGKGKGVDRIGWVEGLHLEWNFEALHSHVHDYITRNTDPSHLLLLLPLSLLYYSGMLLIGVSRRSTMRWRGKRGRSTCRCIPGGVPGTTTLYIKRESERSQSKPRTQKTIAVSGWLLIAWYHRLHCLLVHMYNCTYIILQWLLDSYSFFSNVPFHCSLKEASTGWRGWKWSVTIVS